jgi:hypothetical protein
MVNQHPRACTAVSGSARVSIWDSKMTSVIADAHTQTRIFELTASGCCSLVTESWSMLIGRCCGCRAAGMRDVYFSAPCEVPRADPGCPLIS